MLTHTISILHIADLHKKADDNFDNLLNSLVEDCDSYTAKGITKPNVIVVSGDLIRGGKPEEISKQYQETKEFLEKLTDHFLKGDKSRIIIVPGNHDVDWNVSAEAMVSIPEPKVCLAATMTEDESSKAIQEYEGARKTYNNTKDLFLKGKRPTYRWDWKRQELKEIVKEDVYNKRLEQFAIFYHDFYGDDYPLEPEQQVKLFDLKDDGICFVGFNSCYQNDHLNRAGKIIPVSVVEAKKQIRELPEGERLFIGVWHHNVKGLPHVDNYLDYQILNSILGMGIKIALHGHQHYSGVVEEYKDVYDEQERMLLFSTGSLYGAIDQLAYGTPRQYNIIEMEQKGRELHVTVHLRQDNNTEEYEMPNWGDGITKGTSKPHWETTIILPPLSEEQDSLNRIVEEGMRSGDYATAITELKKLDTDLPGVRKVLVSFMEKGEDYRGIVEFIREPVSVEEERLLVNAAVNLKDPAINSAVRNIESIKNSNDPMVKQMRAYL